MAIDAVLLAAGIGLIMLRRWAALLALAILFVTGIAVTVLIAIIAGFLTVTSWRTLTWGHKLDPLLVLPILMIDGLIHYVVFVLRHS